LRATAPIYSRVPKRKKKRKEKNRSCTFTQIHYPPRYVYLYRVTLKTCFTRHRLGDGPVAERAGWRQVDVTTTYLASQGRHTRARVGVSRVLEPDALDSARLINFALRRINPVKFSLRTARQLSRLLDQHVGRGEKNLCGVPRKSRRS